MECESVWENTKENKEMFNRQIRNYSLSQQPLKKIFFLLYKVIGDTSQIEKGPFLDFQKRLKRMTVRFCKSLGQGSASEYEVSSHRERQEFYLFRRLAHPTSFIKSPPKGQFLSHQKAYSPPSEHCHSSRFDLEYLTVFTSQPRVRHLFNRIFPIQDHEFPSRSIFV